MTLTGCNKNNEHLCIGIKNIVVIRYEVHIDSCKFQLNFVKGHVNRESV